MTCAGKWLADPSGISSAQGANPGTPPSESLSTGPSLPATVLPAGNMGAGQQWDAFKELCLSERRRVFITEHCTQ